MSTKTNITVNGAAKTVEKTHLSYDDVVELGYGKVIPYMTVVYHWKQKGSDIQRSGMLYADKSVEIAEGMHFTAVNTGNA